jgi:hypothetical protein
MSPESQARAKQKTEKETSNEEVLPEETLGPVYFPHDVKVEITESDVKSLIKNRKILVQNIIGGRIQNAINALPDKLPLEYHINTGSHDVVLHICNRHFVVPHCDRVEAFFSAIRSVDWIGLPDNPAPDIDKLWPNDWQEILATYQKNIKPFTFDFELPEEFTEHLFGYVDCADAENELQFNKELAAQQSKV